MTPFQMTRIGLVMSPEPGNSMEVEGVLNPAVVRGSDGQLYLFPRLVGQGNYSRIGIARVLFNKKGDPYGVERLGIALEPETPYELNADGTGGCEDPRVTYVEPLGHYVMTYTALSSRGPRIALAVSEDLLHWRKLGLVSFEPFEGIEFDGVANKDASTFPAAIPDPFGNPALALLHRPLFPGTCPEEKMGQVEPLQDLHRESIWISYRDIDMASAEPYQLTHFTRHHRLAAPQSSWEMLKIGGGAPPILTRLGWLVIYHGVHEITEHPSSGDHLCYSAGAMVLSAEDPSKVIYRSATPILTPGADQELHGLIPNVVFPTGIDRRDDLEQPERLDIYYGMADDRIGVARLTVPASLPTEQQPHRLRVNGT